MAELRALGVDRVRLSAFWSGLAPATRPGDAARPRGLRPGPARRPRPRHRLGARARHRRSCSTRAAARPLGAGPPGQAAAPAQLRRGSGPTPRRSARYDGDARRARLPARSPRGRSGTSRTGTACCSRSPSQGRARRRRSSTAACTARRPRRCARRATGATSRCWGRRRRSASRARARCSPLSPAPFYRALFCLDRRGRRRAGRAVGELPPPRPAARDGRRPPPVPRARAAGVPLHRPRRDPPGRRRAARPHPRRRPRAAAASAGTLPLWYTEFGYQTNPPDPIRGIPPRRQATWNVRGEYLAFRDPRVGGLDAVPARRHARRRREYPAHRPPLLVDLPDRPAVRRRPAQARLRRLPAAAARPRARPAVGPGPSGG